MLRRVTSDFKVRHTVDQDNKTKKNSIFNGEK